MARKWIAIFVIAVIAFGGFAAVTTDAKAKDAKGCEGLADYRAEMFKIGRDYLETLDKAGIKTGLNADPFSMSESDFQLVADALKVEIEAMKKIDPPEFAVASHEARIEYSEMGQQIMLAAAVGGIFATMPFKDASDAAEAKLEAAKAEPTSCPDFAQFLLDIDAIDGEIDGTPVATPTD